MHQGGMVTLARPHNAQYCNSGNERPGNMLIKQ